MVDALVSKGEGKQAKSQSSLRYVLSYGLSAESGAQIWGGSPLLELSDQVKSLTGVSSFLG